jgi:delta 1-pyrroline-5-carboxylate dehydrogenase
MSLPIISSRSAFHRNQSHGYKSTGCAIGVSSRSLSVNTTAQGGNASLMALEEN